MLNGPLLAAREHRKWLLSKSSSSRIRTARLLQPGVPRCRDKWGTRQSVVLFSVSSDSRMGALGSPNSTLYNSWAPLLGAPL